MNNTYTDLVNKPLISRRKGFDVKEGYLEFNGVEPEIPDRQIWHTLKSLICLKSECNKKGKKNVCQRH